jgi:hypothetical protein
MMLLAWGCTGSTEGEPGGVSVGDRDDDDDVDVGDPNDRDDDPFDRDDLDDDDDPQIPGDPDDDPGDDVGDPVDACEQCVEASCAGAWQACENDAECIALDECSANCADDACVQRCDEAHPTGVAPLVAFYECLGTSCADPCEMGEDVQDPNEDEWAACDQCAGQSCQQSFDACEEDQDCTALLQCYDGCGENDEDCWIQCEEQHETGANIYFAFLDCLAASCAQPCGF